MGSSEVPGPASLYVGTYARNGGAGLYALCRSASGIWSVGEASAVALNASFATFSRRHGLHYLVDEREGGMIAALRRSNDVWLPVARVSSGGALPCYLALNRDETCLAVANYGSGSIALFQLDDRSGLPDGPGDVRQNAGRGPAEDRQDGPHAHCACFSPDQRWLYHVDLGTDAVLAYAFNPATRALGKPGLAFRAPPGAGPRHIQFHPTRPHALLVSELASMFWVLRIGDRQLSAMQGVSTLPSDFNGESLGGHLSLSAAADRVYVSNRGHDSIAVFAWSSDGQLKLLQHMASGGASPRHFLLLEAERQMVVAHEESGNVTVFDLLPDGTIGGQRADLSVPGAAFLFAP